MGYASVEFNVPVSEHTRFEIASLTKPFTALLVLQLVQQGKLNLDDKLITYLPEVTRPDAKAITLHHMLSHTSGIQDYVGIHPSLRPGPIKRCRRIGQNPHFVCPWHPISILVVDLHSASYYHRAGNG
jgi:CubicO group peptidase (beta-lactamase class C family)